MIRHDGIEVQEVGMKLITDPEELDLEYLKIVFVLPLPFDDILRYQEKFYANHLESIVDRFFQKRGLSIKDKMIKFMNILNISFDDALA